ncbi:unnamed protein product [Sphenostylis stenocarpa]|uniref:Uncharacterized protein n=1 Tax=Sphenostylis stenocarpa TaxID=92480 RepID=A0AA86VYG0_9FABA|nr:unnamed protein product [Sphenostylis stenocarpa]
MALLLRLHRRSTTNSRIVFFSTSNADSNSNSPFSSLLREIKISPKQSSPPSSDLRSQKPWRNEIQKNLTEFRARTTPPPPGEPQQHNQQLSFQGIYHRNMQRKTSGGQPSISLKSIKENLRIIPGGQNSVRPSRPGLTDGTSALPDSIFGKEMRKEGSAMTAVFSAGFLKTYSMDELGKKLRMLRPEGQGKGWFSVRELSERLVRLRQMEKEQARSNTQDDAFDKVRGCLVEIQEEETRTAKKASVQGLSILTHLSGTQIFSLDPPKLDLVEKAIIYTSHYFHPDNMSSEEKLKIELAKVRDEFKMSESDCGSARVQIAQLTTKIKHLSAVLHKKLFKHNLGVQGVRAKPRKKCGPGFRKSAEIGLTEGLAHSKRRVMNL